MRLLVLAVLLAACSNTPSLGPPGQSGQPTSAELFSSTTSRVIFEVDYQKGAEPYTGSAGLMLSDVWQVTRDNVARLFQGHAKQVTIPSALSDMQALPDLGGISGNTFTAEQVLAIAQKHRDQPSTPGTATYYVLFLDGYFADQDGTNMNVLGVSIGTSGVIAMFKPVIASADSQFPGAARSVEQSTMVHEFGHAVGLVNNGIALKSAHQDMAHGAHCSNDKCVMYWANEGGSSAIAFAQQALTGGSKVLFAADCLADVDAEAAANP